MKKLSLILSIMIVCSASGFSQQSPPLIKDPPLIPKGHALPVIENPSKSEKDDHANNRHYKQHKYKVKKRFYRRKRR